MLDYIFHFFLCHFMPVPNLLSNFYRKTLYFVFSLYSFRFDSSESNTCAQNFCKNNEWIFLKFICAYGLTNGCDSKGLCHSGAF